MKKLMASILLLAAPLLLLSSTSVHAQALEELELRTVEDNAKKDWSFGALGIFETSSGLNKDRPEVGSLIWLSPQLKYKEIYRLQLNMGLIINYLERSRNPWDLTDWSVQLSDLKVFSDEEYTKLSLSANLRYYFPTSVASRNADSKGALRLLTKLSGNYWKFSPGLELTGYYRFAKYTTADTNRWHEPDKIPSNGRISFGERLVLGFTPVERLTTTLSFGLYQHQDYYPSEPYDGVGSSFIAEEPRQNDTWEHSWAAGLDVNVNVWKYFYTAVGYSISMPVLQGDSRGKHYNPLDSRYGVVYLDLMLIY